MSTLTNLHTTCPLRQFYTHCQLDYIVLTIKCLFTRC